jgi:hypothetical protein
MSDERSRTELGALIAAHPWSRAEFVAHYNRVADELGEATSLSLRQLDRWIRGDLATGLPQSAARRVLRHIFALPAERLFSVVMNSDGRDGQGDDEGSCQEEREWVMAAAHESRDHATDVGGFDVAEATLADLRYDIDGLARSYHRTSPTALLSDALAVRNRVWRLLDRAHRPARATDLYVAAGHVCALMAAASFDLGYVTAAEQQARAARTYADLIDYRPLMAWCFGLEAEAAYWTGAPRRALDLVSAGLAIAPAGTARVRLHCIGARAWSYMGPATADRVSTALSAGNTERETGLGDELHDELGGHFSFSRARQARCNATTYVQLGSGAEASEQAGTALELYAPTGGQWRLIEAEVRADLAAARLLTGDLDGAEVALAPVWGLATHDRREGLLHRLRQAGLPLADPRWRDVARVEQLAEQIETFAAASIVRALPAGQA